MDPKIPPPPPSAAGVSILPPMSLRPGNHERGWNDPPVFAVEVNSTGKPAPTKLNKRVAYPGLTSNPTSATTPPSMQVPLPDLPPGNANDGSLLQPLGSNINTRLDPPPRPPSSGAPHTIPPTNIEFIPTFPTPGGNQGELKSEGNNNNTRSDFAGTEPAKNEPCTSPAKNKDDILKVLNDAVEETSIEGFVEEEVRKRLGVLSSSWEKLSPEVQWKLGDLTCNLLEKDYKSAESAMLALSSDFMSQCGPWIVAIKNIIRANTE